MNIYINHYTSIAQALLLMLLILTGSNQGHSQTQNLIVSGQTHTEYGRGIPGVAIGGTTTDSNGLYLIESQIPIGGELPLEPKKNTAIRNGIATDDLIEISKVILYINTPVSPYRMIAADANRNGIVSTFDMVVIKKMLLDLPLDTSSFNYGWRFISSDFIFPDPLNPFTNPLPEVFTVNGPDTISNVDFIGIKVGDYTGNAAPNLLIQPEDRGYSDELAFTIEDQKIEKGSTQTIYLRSQEALQLNGFQFSLQFDPEQVEIIDLQRAEQGLKETHAGLSNAQKGIIHILAYETLGRTVEAEAPLIRLTIRAKEDLLLSEALTIGASHLQPELYQPNTEVAQLKLEYKASPGNTPKPLLKQVTAYPNPFSDHTTIGFYQAQSGLTTLTLSDQSGRVISQQTQFLTEGQHQWIVSPEVSDSQLFFYQLEGPEVNAQGRLIRQQ